MLDFSNDFCRFMLRQNTSWYVNHIIYWAFSIFLLPLPHYLANPSSIRSFYYQSILLFFSLLIFPLKFQHLQHPPLSFSSSLTLKHIFTSILSTFPLFSCVYYRELPLFPFPCLTIDFNMALSSIPSVLPPIYSHHFKSLHQYIEFQSCFC